MGAPDSPMIATNGLLHGELLAALQGSPLM
jgi:hypothetical protein